MLEIRRLEFRLVSSFLEEQVRRSLDLLQTFWSFFLGLTNKNLHSTYNICNKDAMLCDLFIQIRLCNLRITNMEVVLHQRIHMTPVCR